MESKHTKKHTTRHVNSMELKIHRVMQSERHHVSANLVCYDNIWIFNFVEIVDRPMFRMMRGKNGRGREREEQKKTRVRKRRKKVKEKEIDKEE